VSGRKGADDRRGSWSRERMRTPGWRDSYRTVGWLLWYSCEGWGTPK